VVLGRTAQVAWGFTNTNPDVQDLYLEQINPADASQYRTPTGWENLPCARKSSRSRARAMSG
jgi:penicillin amidase